MDLYDKKYKKLYNSDTVVKARNAWHKAAIRLDRSRRGENLGNLDKLIETEHVTHSNYMAVKEKVGILGNQYKNWEDDDN